MIDNKQPIEIVELQKQAYEESVNVKNEIFNKSHNKSLFVPICFIVAFLFIFFFFVTSIMNKNDIEMNFLKEKISLTEK